MDTNKIREAGNKMRDALRQYIGDGVGGPHVEALSSWSKAIAELDKAQQQGKVLTDEEIKRIVDEDITEMSHVGLAPNDAAALKMSRAFMERGLRYARDNGYLAPAAGLTEEEAMEVFRRFSGEHVSVLHMDFLLDSEDALRSRLTAAINAKKGGG